MIEEVKTQKLETLEKASGPLLRESRRVHFFRAAAVGLLSGCGLPCGKHLPDKLNHKDTANTKRLERNHVSLYFQSKYEDPQIAVGSLVPQP